MKYKEIIIFSDIHASLGAVAKIREYMKKHHINLAINLGDFISNGQYACEVFDQLIQDEHFINVKGYDEECLFDQIKAEEGIGQGEWLIKKLGKERMKKLEALPSIREITINGKKILICHHNGWAQLKQLQAHTKKVMERKYALIAYGGSHLQSLTYENEIFTQTMIIDPGALKPNEEHQGKFAVVNMEGSEFQINFHSIKINEVDREITKIHSAKEVEEDQEEEEQKDTFLYINNKDSKDTNKVYIADEVIERIIDIGIKQCKYVSIGCWKQEKKKIKEILYHLKCRAVKSSEEDDQEWYIGEITDDVKDLLKNKRKEIDGKLKWFEISFQNSVNDGNVMYSIFHYGKESFLRRLSTKELYNMEELLERYNILYFLPEDKAKNQN